VFTKLSEEHSDVVFAKVDVDECNASAADAGIEVPIHLFVEVLD
jgi:hypothetical protein